MLRLLKSTCFVLLLIITTACNKTPELTPLNNDAVLLAFGDSLTFGTGAAPEQSYPAQLQALIGRTVINAGVPGEVSQAGLARLPSLLERHRPQLVILCHGGNDILRRYDLTKTASNLQQMITLIQAHNAEVVLVAVPEFGLFLSAEPIYSELAALHQIPLANSIISDILSDNRLKADRIHPNAAGYRQLAEYIQALLIDTGALR